MKVAAPFSCVPALFVLLSSAMASFLAIFVAILLPLHCPAGYSLQLARDRATLGLLREGGECVFWSCEGFCFSGAPREFVPSSISRRAGLHPARSCWLVKPLAEAEVPLCVSLRGAIVRGTIVALRAAVSLGGFKLPLLNAWPEHHLTVARVANEAAAALLAARLGKEIPRPRLAKVAFTASIQCAVGPLC